jgi:hypothetical protein
MTLSHACAHLTNYTAAHESRTHLLGPARLAYPPRHIEIDNRLSFFLGRLDARFGNDAAYVHLWRDPEAVAQSWAARANQGMMHAYRFGIMSRARNLNRKAELIDFCRDYVDTATTNIRAFLRDKTTVMTMQLETIGADFDRFVDWSGAEGDLDGARAELHVRHNATLPGSGQTS